MTLEEKEKRYAWLRSQEAWHMRKAKGANWHTRQMHWYRRQANKVFTYTEILQRTIIKRAPGILDNITQNNALFARFANARLQSTVNMV